MSFRQTLPLLTQKSRSKSSKEWISRQFRDPYIKKRLTDPAAYRSRSAFKLLEINDHMGGFLDHRDVRTVVDLGAAPGGWSQVVAGKFGRQARGVLHLDGRKRGEEFGNERDNLEASYASSCESEEQVPFRSFVNSGQVRKPVQQKYENSDLPRLEDDLLASPPGSAHRGRRTIVAVDLLPIEPIDGVHIVRGDFLLGSTTENIRRLLASKNNANANGMADVILSDIAGNISGNTAHDTESSLEICEAVFEFARSNLRSARAIGRRKGGVLLVKFFAHPLLDQFRKEKLDPNFHYVRYIKPDSSRKASREGYFFCQGWVPR